MLWYNVGMITQIKKSARRHAHVGIIDDHETVKRIMLSLKKEGYKVEHLEHMSRVIERVKNEQVDVLILAVDTWGAKAYELISAIKKNNRFFPIIVTSADDSLEVEAKVREHGIFFYALKPLDMKEIKLVLKNALKRKFTQTIEPLLVHEKKVAQRDFEDEILDLARASKVLKLSKQTVSKLAKKGELPASRIGYRWYFIRNQLLEWLRVTAAGNQRNYGTLILETMDEGVAIVDRRLRIVSCNSAYLQALDVPRERIIGEYCYRVSHRSIVPCDESTCPVRQAFKTKKPVKFMHVNYDNDGNEHYCDVIALPIKDRQDKILQVVEVIRDNTEIYNLNKHLNWIMDFFVHEFKKTLGPVVMNISALVDGDLSITIDASKRDEMLLSSLCCLKLLHDMIRNYIISYKGENDKLKCRREIIDVYEHLFKPIIDEFRPILYKKGMTIKTEIKGNRTIYCDLDLIKIAFSNLINNAAKYGSTRTKIECVAVITNKMFALSVFNEGIGVEQNRLSTIFERFIRFDKVGMSGTGLGLHVVKMIAELHKGTVKAESGFLINDKPLTYEEFYMNEKKYDTMKQKVKGLKKFARFILRIPSGETI